MNYFIHNYRNNPTFKLNYFAQLTEFQIVLLSILHNTIKVDWEYLNLQKVCHEETNVCRSTEKREIILLGSLLK